MIQIQQLQKNFKKLAALDDINVQFTEGQVIALIGPNGSGKTTLIKSILGLVRPSSGVIRFNGKDIAGEVGYRNQIGYMPQIGRYPDNMKVGQVFDMIRNIRGADATIDEELYFRFKLDTILDKSMRALSGGTRQKVSAALAFLFDPAILVLDEPTAGLDPLASEILKAKILGEKQKGKLILVTSHILSDLQDVTTHIMYLQEGKMILFQSLEELQLQTGESSLGKAIAWLMKNREEKNALSYLKIAR